MAQDIEASSENTQVQTVSKSPLKILHAGYHRTGTVSVAMALEQLGYGPSWHFVKNEPFFTEKGMNWWCKNDFENYKKAANGEFVDFGEWFNIIKCQSVMDCPTILFFDQMFEQFPDVKVVVPKWRDDNGVGFEKWYKSMCGLVKWVRLGYGFRILQKFLPAIYFLRNLYFHKIIEPFTLEEFLDIENKSNVEKWYYDKLKNIEKKVPKEQLLIFDVRDGWEPLCKFVNAPVPKDEPFPRANDGTSLKKAIRKAVGPLVLSKKFLLACTVSSILVSVLVWMKATQKI